MNTTHSDHAIPGTDDRVPLHTSDASNTRILERTLENLRSFVGASPDAINARIAVLRREWDIERTLEAHAATLAMTGLALGIFKGRRFLAIPAIVAGFLFQHAVQGWCPPLSALRRLGVRTSAEIHAEILALRILRDDFSIRARGAEAALSLALMK
jgi:hypothetical protein